MKPRSGAIAFLIDPISLADVLAQELSGQETVAVPRRACAGADPLDEVPHFGSRRRPYCCRHSRVPSRSAATPRHCVAKRLTELVSPGGTIRLTAEDAEPATGRRSALKAGADPIVADSHALLEPFTRGGEESWRFRSPAGWGLGAAVSGMWPVASTDGRQAWARLSETAKRRCDCES